MSLAAIIAFLVGMKKWPWGLIGIVAATIVVAALGYFFITSVYSRGVSDENARWEAKIAAAQHQSDTANASLQHDVAQRQEQAQSRTITRIQYVNQARQDIANAADTQTRYAAYLALRDRLRNAAAEHLNRAIQNYVSGLA